MNMVSGTDYPATSDWNLLRSVPVDSGECLRCLDEVKKGEAAYVRAVPTDRIEAIHACHGHPGAAFPHFGTSEEKRAWIEREYGPFDRRAHDDERPFGGA